MKKTLSMGMALAFSSTLFGVAHADDAKKHSFEHDKPRFERFDRAGNGIVTRDEFLARAAKRAERMFEKLDTNDDGVLTKADKPPRRFEGGDKEKHPHAKKHEKRGDGERKRVAD